MVIASSNLTQQKMYLLITDVLDRMNIKSSLQSKILYDFVAHRKQKLCDIVKIVLNFIIYQDAFAACKKNELPF